MSGSLHTENGCQNHGLDKDPAKTVRSQKAGEMVKVTESKPHE
jgi:hypothetical protein